MIEYLSPIKMQELYHVLFPEYGPRDGITHYDTEPALKSLLYYTENCIKISCANEGLNKQQELDCVRAKAERFLKISCLKLRTCFFLYGIEEYFDNDLGKSEDYISTLNFLHQYFEYPRYVEMENWRPMILLFEDKDDILAGMETSINVFEVRY